jgi:catechol 2,3-dioxygenase-like lactoylglutathione lyase family enzyme
MTIGIIEINHVNVVVPKHLEDEAKRFYASVLGMKEIPKPAESQARGGAWYELGNMQLHLSVRVDAGNNQGSKGHVCFTVADVESAAEVLRTAGVEIIPDDRPIMGKRLFYVRDPGANLLEIAQRT